MAKFIKIFITLLIVGVVGAWVLMNYSWVFSKRVRGKIVDVERVTDPTAILGNRATEEQMYSYSILIQDEEGSLYASSSIDRQWQVVKKGYCVEALLYRYPPWEFDKANTFFNARVKSIHVCPGQTGLPENTTGPTGPPGAAQPPTPPPPTAPILPEAK